jgi:hypothetical protein
MWNHSDNKHAQPMTGFDLDVIEERYWIVMNVTTLMWEMSVRRSYI